MTTISTAMRMTMMSDRFKPGDHVTKRSGLYSRAGVWIVTAVEDDRVTVMHPEIGVRVFGAGELKKVEWKEKLPPKLTLFEKVLLHEADFEVGDRVTFTQVWYSNPEQFEGEIITLDKPPGTAVVRYEVPKHLQDAVNRINELQAPIGIFALSKIPEVESLSDDDNALIEAAWHGHMLAGAEPVAPDGCWIERKKKGNCEWGVYRSRTPMFLGKGRGALCKSRYIGPWGSPAVAEAEAAIARRNELTLPCLKARGFLALRSHLPMQGHPSMSRGVFSPSAARI